MPYQQYKVSRKVVTSVICRCGASNTSGLTARRRKALPRSWNTRERCSAPTHSCCRAASLPVPPLQVTKCKLEVEKQLPDACITRLHVYFLQIEICGYEASHTADVINRISLNIRHTEKLSPSA